MGWQQLETRIKRGAQDDPVRVIPFLTVGFPDVEATLELAPALEQAGATAIELGVPFSDPLAEGPTIQKSSYQALTQGVTLAQCLEMSGELRRRGVQVPLVLMGYYNPFLAYGLEEVASDAEKAGVDGFIVPDLPVEEHAPMLEACLAHQLALIPMLAPTSTEERIKASCASAHGFIYCVSLVGITGARDKPSPEATALIQRVRKYTSLPLAVGFGISRREQVDALGDAVDAVAVGSALVDIVADASPGERVAKVQAFMAGLGATPNLAGGPRS